tara:strand:+ start:371 stop:523 length:153 start_codon:yes stop_codon:yes gene_type:complete
LSDKGKLAMNNNIAKYIALLFDLIRKKSKIAIGIAVANESKNKKKQATKK